MDIAATPVPEKPLLNDNIRYQHQVIEKEGKTWSDSDRPSSFLGKGRAWKVKDTA